MTQLPARHAPSRPRPTTRTLCAAPRTERARPRRPPRAALDAERRAREGRDRRREGLLRDLGDWTRRLADAERRVEELAARSAHARASREAARAAPETLAARRETLRAEHAAATTRRRAASDSLADAEAALAAADRAHRLADAAASAARERRAVDSARFEAAATRRDEAGQAIRVETGIEPQALRDRVTGGATGLPSDPAALDQHLRALEGRRDALGPVNLRAAEEAAETSARVETMASERADLSGAVAKLRAGVEALNAEGRERLLAAFDAINADFQSLFQTLFEGGEAELKLVESPDPLEAGLEIYACPPGKRMATMTLMSGGEQALTATALIFAVFLSNPSPVCVLDEVDAPLDDANVDRFCRMLDAMRRRTATRFIAITHNPVTMSRMDRLFGVTMAERGVSQTGERGPEARGRDGRGLKGGPAPPRAVRLTSWRSPLGSARPHGAGAARRRGAASLRPFSMSDPRLPTDDRLRDLSARADALERSTARPVAAAGASHGAAANQAYRIIADLIGGVVVGLAIGFGLDRLAPLAGFRTAPAGLLTGVLAGFAVSVWMAKRTADRLVAQARIDNPNPPSVPPDDGDED